MNISGIEFYPDGKDEEISNLPPSTGLSPEHAAELNSFATVPEEVRQARYAELRVIYADNLFALEEIDIFDKSSPYGEALKRYVKAIQHGDKPTEEELEKWFIDNYPLTEASRL
jgi:hypothetical protein